MHCKSVDWPTDFYGGVQYSTYLYCATHYVHELTSVADTPPPRTVNQVKSFALCPTLLLASVVSTKHRHPKLSNKDPSPCFLKATQRRIVQA